MSDLQKVLLVEDSLSIVRLFTENIRGRVCLHSACSTVDARQVLAEHPDISAIIMDGQVLDGSTEDFVRELRKSGYDRPIIAASSAYNDRLMKAGCCIDSKKQDAWRHALRAVGIEPERT